ncbi:MAG: TIGR02646 family protein [Chitinophagales bacterium]|nr:TIGR02646 family protein [Chitinophagales bacterium]
MRPLNKLKAGDTLPSGIIIQETYQPHGNSYPPLKESIGGYCSYCEVFSSNLEVEHIISRKQDISKAFLWDNFLLSCAKCNGKDNKTDTPVVFKLQTYNNGTPKLVFDNLYFPHLNNTLLAFEYREAGFIAINPNLNDEQKQKAQNTIDLLCLDKYLGNPKYPSINPRDERHEYRRSAWEFAINYLEKYEQKENTATDIAHFAAQRGFFSIWFTVFKNHNEVKKALIEAFTGTCSACFDTANNYQPLWRNPNDL